MPKFSIDINADVGEGVGNENELMPYLSSCNIACGGHAGDLITMTHVAKLAAKHGVKIGAHPSFPDKVNFGRLPMTIDDNNLSISLLRQINDLYKVLVENDLTLNHVKPHGALYNLAATNMNKASLIIAVIKELPSHVKLYVPFGSIIADLAIKNNIPIVYEAFADRNYNDDLTLVSRKENNALIHDADEMFQHVHKMVTQQKVRTLNGNEVDIEAQTFCLHGDNPEAINLLKSLRLKLEENGIEVL